MHNQVSTYFRVLGNMQGGSLQTLYLGTSMRRAYVAPGTNKVTVLDFFRLLQGGKQAKTVTLVPYGNIKYYLVMCNLVTGFGALSHSKSELLNSNQSFAGQKCVESKLLDENQRENSMHVLVSGGS